MGGISEIDANLRVDTKINKDDIRFYDVKNAPFQIYGVRYDNGKFRRLPEQVACGVNKGVAELHACTAGGRVRFCTDSPYIAIYVKIPNVGRYPHMPLTCSAGLDLYVWDEGQRYVKSFMPPYGMVDGYESVIELPYGDMREYTINLPLYSEVSELYVGIRNTASLAAPREYTTQKPVVFYGSSITQGACASRPGRAYESILSRRFDFDYINLGFSGHARGEREMAEYISQLDMTAFVYDYDYNAPTIAHLEETHQRMFQIVRKANPELPILLLSRPKYYLTQGEEERLVIIRKTFQNAQASGDRNVYLLDGRTLMEMAGGEGTVDDTHPNDLGFASMAEAVGAVFEKIL